MKTLFAVLAGLTLGAAGGVGAGYAVWHEHDETTPAVTSVGRCTPSARQRFEDLDNMTAYGARVLRYQIWPRQMTQHQLEDIAACEAER